MEADISIWQKSGHFYFALTGFSSLLGLFSRPPIVEISALLR
jgi:hypothetical protein